MNRETANANAKRNELNSHSSIEAWRKAKEQADDDGFKETLGCVGTPISDAIEAILPWVKPEYVEDVRLAFDRASVEARSNLLDYVNSARQDGADELLHDIEQCVSFDIYDIELDASDSLADVAAYGFEQCLNAITGICWTASELESENL